MRHLILAFTFLPLLSSAQIGYTVTVTKLMATADDCDGGGLCLSAPQDPVFSIWVTDAEANEHTNCWAFDNDDDMEYGLWNDITDYELANESYVNTNYISFELAAFESDALSGISCSSGGLDDNVYDRAFNKLITTASMPMNVVYTDTLVVGGMYNVVVDILWHDYANIDENPNELAVAISPNPSNGVFNVQLTEADANDFQLEIYDISGMVVYSESVTSKQAAIDLSRHNSGTYFIKVITENKSVVKKVLLHH